MDSTTPYGEAAWNSPAWLREATAWVDARLAAIGREQTSALELERVRRWSALARTETRQGRVWMKAARPECAVEVELYEPIERAVPGLAPELLAADPGRGWLLLADAGAPLADGGDEAAVMEAFASVLPRYAELQRALAPEAAGLVAGGAADHRPPALEALLGEVCDEVEERLRGAGDPDGVLLTLDAIRASGADVARWTHELAGAPVPASVDHGDLTPANVLTGPAGTRIVDWGDAVVGHPFASLRLVLGGARARLECPAEDPRIQRLRDAYLEPWSDVMAPAELRALAATACRAAPISWAAIILRATRSQPGEPPPGVSWATFCVRELEELVGPNDRR